MLKDLELERTENYRSTIMKYYDLKKDDVLIVFHNIGINAATIDAVMEAKKNGVKIIAVSSTYWQDEIPEDHFIRHPSKKNLFDFADVAINDFNPLSMLLMQYTDASEVSDYAKTVAVTLIKNIIISGANGKTNPKGNATRAEVAVIIKRILDIKR